MSTLFRRILITLFILNILHSGLSLLDDVVNPMDYSINHTELSYVED